ncbi:MAG: hypothetical protein UX15_C0004G0008 [Parcubacteria group bacterium GW2011_GWA1_45_7]|nr:MAG: hypothetical protein US61_C0041G0003 [Parcubacteria group bacterium GW2011_GWE2_37_8]KKU11485.1 MAG: hypothetical protein UX15_C0004G0008 [Parcubacteria group bacterium GW2011_GWA1_45_7]
MLAFEQPLWFSLLYLPHHFSYSLAPFHLEMFHLIQQTEQNLVVVMAFRESGKSTILNTANILWSILGKPEKKFVLIVSKTQEQAKSHFANIKAELENNELLKEDFGPFTENADDLKKLSLELVYHGSKIMSVTREQSIRGLKYGRHRPDLIIMDDIEDSSTNSIESEMLYKRLKDEILPLGSERTHIIVLGNFLSRSSLLMQLKNDIQHGIITGLFRMYPLLDYNDTSLWPAKFSGLESLKNLLTKVTRETLMREYMLNTNGHSRVHELVSSLSYTHLDQKDLPIKNLGLKYDRLLQKHLWERCKPEKVFQRPLIEQMRQFQILSSAPDLNLADAKYLIKIKNEYNIELREIYKEQIGSAHHSEIH